MRVPYCVLVRDEPEGRRVTNNWDCGQTKPVRDATKCNNQHYLSPFSQYKYSFNFYVTTLMRNKSLIDDDVVVMSRGPQLTTIGG